jgi:hypothetical protein
MPSPLEDIENRNAQHGIGVFGLRVYQGARSDGGSRLDALLVTVAFFRAIVNGADDTPATNEEV